MPPETVASVKPIIDDFAVHPNVTVTTKSGSAERMKHILAWRNRSGERVTTSAPIPIRSAPQTGPKT